MQRVTIVLTVLGVLVLALLTMPTSAQKYKYPSPDYPFPGYPEEFSPLRTSRPAKPQISLTPATKFVKAKKPISNHYIVVLNDDVVDNSASLTARRAAVKAIADAHAQAHLGKVGYIYETALKGYSIELPNEAAAVALSNNPKVSWVEQEAQGELMDGDGGNQTEAIQTNPPWGLDAIDNAIPVASPDANGRTNGFYIYNATGAGVTAYVLDTGINTAHTDFSNGFSSRASQAANCIAFANCQSGAQSPYWNQDICVYPYPNSINNDCFGHGTHVAGTIGGNTYGVAKGVTIRSVKVAIRNGGPPPLSQVIAGVNWVTSNHQANPSVPAVVNMSLGYPTIESLDTAVSASIASGLTYVVAAGNSNDDAQYWSPARVPTALTVGAVDWTGTRWAYSNWGSSVDLFAPGVGIVSAVSGNGLCTYWDGSNNSTCIPSGGTSFAAPHVAGAVALYLQGRTGTSLCGSYPIQGAAPSFGEFSTCPDRVAQFIDANANLNRLSNINGVIYDQYGNVVSTIPSPNRFLWTVAIPSRSNPIDNERFFVWQQYADFLTNQQRPDEGGLDWWTSEIIGHGHCSAGVNDITPCTDVWRVLTSRAFWIASHGELFTSNYGLRSGMNGRFVELCYQIYLRRNPDPGGYNFWVNELGSNFGDPASPDGVFHLIDAFIRSGPPDGYRRRFGP